MKLLIVDDEELTRIGLISSLDWTSLGIHEIYQADDGINGLHMARIHRPEIILCDVRMPRMDGIAMLEQLEKEHPDFVPVFMSGYSDKEYLKAAIRLKAVTYIEKPLDPAEVREAILEAQSIYIQKAHSRRAETMHSMENMTRLALLLTSPFETNHSNIQSLLLETRIPVDSGTYFTAFVIKMDKDLEVIRTEINRIRKELEEKYADSSWSSLFAEKRHQYLVYYLYGASRLEEHNIREIGEELCELHKKIARCLVTAGGCFQGVENAYHSYMAAVVLLQNCFFYPQNRFYTDADITDANRTDKTAAGTDMTGIGTENTPVFDHDHLGEDYLGLLFERNEEKTTVFLQNLNQYYSENHSVLINQAKDSYYKMFVSLDNARRNHQLPPIASSSHNAVEYLEKCFSYQDLHETLVHQTAAYFRDISEISPENPTIKMIREYIEENYSNELLSVKDIGEHVALSTSYLCTFFKNETGKTLNQYLTDFRMEKAKQLLDNPRYRITEISSMVGYSDGNYFGKSFKKHTGSTPSEYREKNQ